MNFFETVAQRARKRALYRKTLAELRDMPRDTAIDLDIAVGDMERIAHQAVYGR